MSATNRGTKRREADYYATPEAAFRPLLPYLHRTCERDDLEVWEPACGDGRLLEWMNEYGIESDGSDLSKSYDFLKDGKARGVIVTNPPFSLALEFCDHAIAHSPNVFMLLRLNFLASEKRHEWWKLHKPSALFVLSKRPSFTEDGQTDATDYAWFYWGKLHQGIHFLEPFVL